MGSVRDHQHPVLSWPKRLLLGLLPVALLMAGVEAGARLVGQAVMSSRQAEIPTIERPERSQRAAQVDQEAELRVWCVGDSWTFGVKLPPEGAYPGQLQAVLRQEHGLQAQVFNLGSPGATSYRAARMVRSKLGLLPADLIVLQIGANQDVLNFEDDPDSGGALVWTLRSWLRRLASYRMLVQVVARGRVLSGDNLYDLDEQIDGQPLPLRDDKPTLRRTLGANIGRIHDMALMTDAQLLLLTYGLPAPFLEHCTQSEHLANGWIREIAAERGLPLVDMGQLYLERDVPVSTTLRALDGASCAKSDPHPNEEGYGIYAREIASWIVANQERLTRSGR
jgi:lysophospholipase L1-like esterase